MIAKLVEDLGLSSDQAAELEVHFGKMVVLSGGMFSGEINEENSTAGMAAIAALEGKGLEDLMEELLTPEQKEEWTQSEEKRVHRLADSGALKKLAGLGSAIEMREDQRDAVYDHFYQKELKAEKDSSQEGAMASAISGNTAGFGIEVDLSGLLETDYGALVEESSGDDGEINMQELFRKQREQQVASKVEELTEILDESQLNEYREQLESQGSFLDGIISGQNGIQVESIVIPSVQ